jgi:hypothetical protein
MQVICLFIPPSTTLEELARFARSGVGLFLSFGGADKVRNCDILDIDDPSQGTHESHGLISFASQADADKAVRRLNGKRLNGKEVDVRLFQNRSPSDQRVRDVRDGKHLFKDSRRKGLVMRKRSEGNQPKQHAIYTPQPEARGAKIEFETVEERMKRK